MGLSRIDQSQPEARMDYAERTAKLVLEATLPGASLCYRSSQSNSEYDFDLTYPGGAIGAVEVTSSRDQGLLETVAAIHNPNRGGSSFPTDLCKKSWIVSLSKGARINSVRKQIDQLLSELEHDGIEDFNCITDGTQAVQKICAGLGIVRGSVIPLGEPPMILMDTAPSGGAVGASSATDAGEAEAWKADIRMKLGKAGTPERHLAVYIDPTNGEAWTALTSLAPPNTVPKLPEEITHLWLFSSGFEADEFFVWSAKSGETWQASQACRP